MRRRAAGVVACSMLTLVSCQLPVSQNAPGSVVLVTPDSPVGAGIRVQVMNDELVQTGQNMTADIVDSAGTAVHMTSTYAEIIVAGSETCCTYRAIVRSGGTYRVDAVSSVSRDAVRFLMIARGLHLDEAIEHVRKRASVLATDAIMSDTPQAQLTRARVRLATEVQE